MKEEFNKILVKANHLPKLFLLYSTSTRPDMLVYCTDAEEAVVVGEMCIILYAVFEKGTNFFWHVSLCTFSSHSSSVKGLHCPAAAESIIYLYFKGVHYYCVSVYVKFLS